MHPLAPRLRVSRLFADLDETWIDRLAASAVARRLAEGEYLWRGGDPARRFTVIQRGLVQVLRTTPSGEPVMVAIFGPRESVGDVAAIQGAPYPADARAASPAVEVLEVPADVVLDAQHAEASVARALQRTLLEHTRALQTKIDILGAGSVPARLATLLLHLAERFGDEDEGGRTHIPVALSRAALSSLVSARVETVSRVMSRWRKAGAADTRDDGFSVDPAALRELATKG